MERPAVLVALSLGVGISWLPVLVQFARAWMRTGHMTNLAIVALVLFALYVPTYLVITLPPSWPIAAVTAVDGLACALFLVAVWLARVRPR